MGFGVLFIGYFFILNISYYFYTDAIAAVLMLLALYKLSDINKPFKQACIVALGFSVFGIGELILNMYSAFAYLPAEETVNTVLAIARYGILLALLVLTLRGMEQVAREVGLNKISNRCSRLCYATAFLYSVRILLELSAVFSLSYVLVMRILTVVVLIASVVLSVMTLIEIYRCYASIYMPGEEKTEKKSRFGIMEKFDEQQQRAAMEYAEYQREKQKKRSEKRKKK